MVYVVRITRADIGARVMIRRRIPGPIPLSDVLGTLRSWSSRVLTVETAEGSAVQITEDDLVAARVIPPRPPRRRSHAVVDLTVDGQKSSTGTPADLPDPGTIGRTQPVDRATIRPMTPSDATYTDTGYPKSGYPDSERRAPGGEPR
ncbi:putative acetyltransferase [Frankia sp. AgKG'84/4]